MLKLLRMEFIFSRKQLGITLAIFSVFFCYMAYRINSPRVFLVTTSLVIGLSVPFQFVGREDKFKTASLVCSLPVRRSTVVLSKYATSWIAIAGGLAYGILLAAVFPMAVVPIGELLNPKSLLVCLAFASLFVCFVLPFTTRFGLTGIIIFLVGTQLLGILLLTFGQILGPKLNLLRTLIGMAENGIRFILYHPPTSSFFLTLVGSIVLMNVLSFFVTKALYVRKEL
jgi:ABC-type transport system involved in multi-copper enzyme maturation permease subunit